MNVHWKQIGSKARPSHWRPMVWAVLTLVLLCTAGTAAVGVKLYSITGHPVIFNTK